MHQYQKDDDTLNICTLPAIGCEVSKLLHSSKNPTWGNCYSSPRIHPNEACRRPLWELWYRIANAKNNKDTLRYKNVAMAGPQYKFFAPDRQKLPPFVRNTRIYSCNLIRNDLPFRWRGRHNEDTIKSLDVLKAGWCTILFNAFLQDKAPTLTIKGGNNTEKSSRGKVGD